MKKLLALLLVGVLCIFTLAGCGDSDEVEDVATEEFATEEFTETSDDLEMEEVTADESAFDGQWVSFNGGFDLYIPTDWQDVEVSDEQAQNNVTYLAQNEDGSMALAISAVDTGLGEEASIQQVAEKLQTADNLTVQGYYNVNGIYCVGITNPDNCCGYAFLGTDGYAYVVVVGPITDTDTQMIAAGITNSISNTAE